MSNFQDRCDDIEFWESEIARKQKRLRHRTPAGNAIGSKQKRQLRNSIEELEIAIEVTRETGGIPEYI